MEGFEWGVLPAGWYTNSGSLATVVSSNPSPRSGSYYLAANNQTGAGLQYGIPRTEIYLQVALYNVNWAYNGPSWIALTCGAPQYSTTLTNVVCTIWMYSGISILQGYNVTTRVAGSFMPSQNIWYLVEAHIIVDAVNGLYELKIDGIPQGSWSGNTTVGALTYIDGFLNPWKSVFSGSTYIDDIIINDTSGTINNSWPGGKKIISLSPTADGSFKQWTPTPAGLTHYSAVDEVPPGSSDYLTTNQCYVIDSFQHPNLPAEAVTSFIVESSAWAMKDSAGSSVALQPCVVAGSTVAVTPSTVLGTSYSAVNSIFDLSPAGTTWDVSTINSLEVGVRSSG